MAAVTRLVILVTNNFWTKILTLGSRHKFLIFFDSQLKERGKDYLARRGDVDEGGILVVVVLVRGGVRTLGRGERLGNPCRKAGIEQMSM